MSILVEPINDIIDSDEQILWSIKVNIGYSNERYYAITNKRVYRREELIPETHYYGAIKEFLRIVGKTLIIERIAVKFFKTTQMGEVYINLRNMDASQMYLAFNDLSLEEIDNAFKMLADSNTISQNHINKFAMEHRELTKSWLMNIELPASSNIPPTPATNMPPHTQEPPPLFTPEKYSQPIIQPSPPSSQPTTPQPLRSSLLSPTRHYHLSEDFRNDTLISMPSQASTPRISPTPQKKNDSSKSTSQIVPASDEMLYFGKMCSYCRKKIEDYEEKIYSCKECGVLYHENCLSRLMNEGICRYCNRTLVW